MPSYLYRPPRLPTLWNQDAALGFLIASSGYLFGPAGLVMQAAGALIGGYIGKKRMEREQEHGKVANEPSFWNKTALVGTLIFPLVGTAIGAYLGKRRQAKEYAYAKAHGIEVDPYSHAPLNANRNDIKLGRSASVDRDGAAQGTAAALPAQPEIPAGSEKSFRDDLAAKRAVVQSAGLQPG